tara:strand:- start:11 stop:151 length:141 start_codon:yes stop_codon:yes gene_type:complete
MAAFFNELLKQPDDDDDETKNIKCTIGTALELPFIAQCTQYLCPRG